MRIAVHLVQDIAEPVLLPDKGIWHPVADKVFENASEYLAWYNAVSVAFPISLVTPSCSLTSKHSYVQRGIPVPNLRDQFEMSNDLIVR